MSTPRRQASRGGPFACAFTSKTPACTLSASSRSGCKHPEKGKFSWAALHVAWRHGARIEAVITLEVDVPRSWLRRSRKGLWYCTRDIPADRIRRLFGFVELARAAG